MSEGENLTSRTENQDVAIAHVSRRYRAQFAAWCVILPLILVFGTAGIIFLTTEQPRADCATGHMFECAALQDWFLFFAALTSPVTLFLYVFTYFLMKRNGIFHRYAQKWIPFKMASVYTVCIVSASTLLTVLAIQILLFTQS